MTFPFETFAGAVVWPITWVPFRIVNVSVPVLMATPAVVLTVAVRFKTWLRRAEGRGNRGGDGAAGAADEWTGKRW